MAGKLEELSASAGAQQARASEQTVVINQQQRTLSHDQVEKWEAIATRAPTIEEIKDAQQKIPDRHLGTKECVTTVARSMMAYDKHGPLDLILDADSHEEIRKWARNRIREMRIDYLEERLHGWSSEIRQPSRDDLLTPAQLEERSDRLLALLETLNPAQRAKACVDKWERISPENACRSVQQLTADLKEAIRRCDSLQCFLSTSLFLFWACDELHHFRVADADAIKAIGGELLRNYVATACLMKQSRRAIGV